MRFSESLDRKLEDIKRPPNPPIGHYIWEVTKYPEMEDFESRKTGKTFERVTVTARVVAPGDDVDPDELAEYGDVQGYQNRKTFLFPDSEEDPAGFDQSCYTFRRFLENCGLAEGDLFSSLGLLQGCQFLGELQHRPDPNDPEVIYAEIKRTSGVE